LPYATPCLEQLLSCLEWKIGGMGAHFSNTVLFVSWSLEEGDLCGLFGDVVSLIRPSPDFNCILLS
jgi:hypothetical protein